MKRTSRIQQLFQNRKNGPKVMSLFVTAGYPDPGKTAALVRELESAGADIIELGMPFSDPLADGPTIQYASQIAIEKGAHIAAIFEMIREIRKTSEIPIVLMGYINPVLRYGLEAFFRDASDAGADGVILPDVPPGELPEVDTLCETYHIDPVYLVAPNTSDERMKLVDQASRGFVYCVSVTGVTGARDGSEVSRSVQQFINRVKRNVTKNPVLIGFGIRSHDDAVEISKQVEGYIVGSALIDFIREVYPDEGWISRTGEFVKKLKTGNESPVITK